MTASKEVNVFRTLFRRVDNPDLRAWVLKQLLEGLPGMLLMKVQDLLEAIADPETPVLKRAVLVALLMEILVRANVQIPVGMLLRFVILHAAFGAAAENRYRGDPRWRAR